MEPVGTGTRYVFTALHRDEADLESGRGSEDVDLLGPAPTLLGLCSRRDLLIMSPRGPSRLPDSYLELAPRQLSRKVKLLSPATGSSPRNRWPSAVTLNCGT